MMNTKIEFSSSCSATLLIRHGRLLLNKAKVKGMFLTEYDQEKVLEQERRDTANNERRRVAIDMLTDNYPMFAIAKISKLSEEAIRKLADKIGITIA